MFGFKQVLSVCCVHRCVPFSPFSGSTELPNVILFSKEKSSIKREMKLKVNV
jgi:hypothetical protein